MTVFVCEKKNGIANFLQPSFSGVHTFPCNITSASERERGKGCLLPESSKFYNKDFLLVGLTTFGTLVTDDDTQNYHSCILKLVDETFEHSTWWFNQSKRFFFNATIS